MAKESARKPGRASPATASASAATAPRKTTSSSISDRGEFLGSPPGDEESRSSRKRPIERVMRRFALLLLLPPLCGCYILTQAQGQLRILLNSQNIDTLLADASVPVDVKL